MLVTRFQPQVEAFLYLDGFARMSSERYSLDPTQLGNKMVHLTNSSVQKEETTTEQARQGKLLL